MFARPIGSIVVELLGCHETEKDPAKRGGAKVSLQHRDHGHRGGRLMVPLCPSDGAWDATSYCNPQIPRSWPDCQPQQVTVRR
jgi:hypothetical protein